MIAHITLATRDVQGSAEFFHDVLGWQRIARPGNIHSSAAWLAIGPGLELHLIEEPGFYPSPFEQEFGRHIAIMVARAEFPQLKERLLSHGAALVEPLRQTPFERFFFRDPNGYMFEVVEKDHNEPRTIV
jgi:catechol 2,3-dioxygenase-like lactoylglutathione lyase family enzyme